MTEGFKKELPTKEGYYKCLIHWREGCNTDDDNDYSIIGLYWINRSWHDFNNGGQEIDSIDYKVLGWCEDIPFNPWHTGIPTEDGEYLVEDVVVRVDDVIWKVDSLLNRKKNTDYTGQLLDQAIDVVLEEIKRCVNEEMPKYNHIFTKEKKDEEKE